MSSPRKREKNQIIDPINEPRVLILPNQTYCYGETPTVICRQHFQKIAESLNLSVEDFAKTVLNKSIGDQLCMLRDYYRTKNEETEEIYNPLIEQCSTKTETITSPEKSDRKPTKTSPVKTRKPPQPLVGFSRKRSNVSVSPSMTRTKEESSSSSIQASIEEAVTSQEASTTCSEKNAKCTIMDVNDDKADANDVGKMSTDPVEDDFETFLYGRSPSRPKAAPKKKSRLSLTTTNTSNDQHRPISPSPVYNPCESPPPQEFLTPGLTFDSNSWSPSRQRDLLSVARDIADLQKSVAAGAKLNDSVSNTILFTKP